MFKSKWRGSWKKITFLIITILITFLFLSWDIIVYDWYGEPKENLHCFDFTGNQLPELNENEPKLGSAIFFHETSCPKDFTDITLNARQSCSVESALRAHPNTDVFLLISSPVFRYLEDSENVFIQQLLTYNNFKLRHITFSKYLTNTPLKIIHSTGALNYSLWPVPHSSDVLRYATLYKFGGVYLDLDVIVLKPLLKLRNFAGAESDESLGSGILGFGFDKVGREVANECALELARTYNGKSWGYNGPGVITRVLQKRCKTSMILNMIKSYCDGFHVYPTYYFSALSFNEPQLFFQPGNIERVRNILNQSYTIHFWNKMSSTYILNGESDIPFLLYAKKYCPKIYETTNGSF